MFNKSQTIATQGVGSGSTNTEEFKAYSRAFKSDLRELLNATGHKTATIEHNTGHFYCSGFIKFKEGWAYYSVSDIRHFKDNRILIRTAKNNKDYTGGCNCYININTAKEDLSKFYFSALTIWGEQNTNTICEEL